MQGIIGKIKICIACLNQRIDTTILCNDIIRMTKEIYTRSTGNRVSIGATYNYFRKYRANNSIIAVITQQTHIVYPQARS